MKIKNVTITGGAHKKKILKHKYQSDARFRGLVDKYLGYEFNSLEVFVYGIKPQVDVDILLNIFNKVKPNRSYGYKRKNRMAYR